MISLRILVVNCLLLLSNNVMACPDGQQPAGAPTSGNPSGCVPYPGAQQSQPHVPRIVWATRWGAIATDDTKGIIGAVKNANNKRSANKAAVKQCKLNGGGKNCEVIFSYYNQCAAIAWGDTTYRGAGRPTLEEAKYDAMKLCSNATTGCKIVLADCSLPQRVQ